MTDVFDQMFPRRPKLDAAGARENIAEMKQHTPRFAAIKMLSLAIGPAGNLTDEARTIYRAELDRLTS